MTTLERYHTAYHEYNALFDAVNRLTKRGKDVPPDLLRQFGATYTAYQAALAEMNRVMAGRNNHAH